MATASTPIPANADPEDVPDLGVRAVVVGLLKLAGQIWRKFTPLLLVPVRQIEQSSARKAVTFILDPELPLSEEKIIAGKFMAALAVRLPRRSRRSGGICKHRERCLGAAPTKHGQQHMKHLGNLLPLTGSPFVHGFTPGSYGDGVFDVSSPDANLKCLKNVAVGGYNYQSSIPVGLAFVACQANVALSLEYAGSVREPSHRGACDSIKIYTRSCRLKTSPVAEKWREIKHYAINFGRCGCTPLVKWRVLISVFAFSRAAVGAIKLSSPNDGVEMPQDILVRRLYGQSSTFLGSSARRPGDNGAFPIKESGSPCDLVVHAYVSRR